jgi:hypothetical protein
VEDRSRGVPSMSKHRMIGLVLVAAALAVAAAVMAVRAFASTAVYCNGCNLPSSGVPAVSGSHSTFSDNYILTSGYADEQIYDYSSSGVTECTAQSDHVDTLTIFCTPYSNPATARCHVLHGTGPETADCQADY